MIGVRAAAVDPDTFELGGALATGDEVLAEPQRVDVTDRRLAVDGVEATSAQPCTFW
ncbi:hypothetical protein BH24ACT13_BH24ACT13_03580 [soil metagenome]|jgi:hypothetical protein